MKHIITIIISVCLLIACNGKAQTNKNNASKAKNIPEVNKMLGAYHKQKHRLAFNGCEMTYNEKPFKLGMTIEELINVLGKYDVFFKGFYLWEDSGITVVTESESKDESNSIIYIYMYMNTKVNKEFLNDLKYMLNHKEDYFLLEGMPIDKNMRVIDFINNSEFSLNDFGVSNYGYELDYSCEGKKIGYRLKADGLWLRKGTGHLTYKDKPNPKNENLFEMLYITEIEE